MKNILYTLLLLISTSILSQELDFYTKEGLILQGYDVVAYFKNGAAKGSEKFSIKYENITYHFASQENLLSFQKNPQKYIPKYGGYCAYAIAVKGKKMSADPKTFEVRDDKLYLFYSSWWNSALKLWNDGDTKELISKADKNWERIKFK